MGFHLWVPPSSVKSADSAHLDSPDVMEAIAPFTKAFVYFNCLICINVSPLKLGTLII